MLFTIVTDATEQDWAEILRLKLLRNLREDLLLLFRLPLEFEQLASTEEHPRLRDRFRLLEQRRGESIVFRERIPRRRLSSRSGVSLQSSGSRRRGRSGAL